MTHKAAQLVERAKVVLLDFDGPVTPLMPPPANAHAADAARSGLGEVELPEALRDTTDHLAVLRWTGTHASMQLADVEAACIDAEVQAARTSDPTPGALDFLTWCEHVGKPVVIVSNNSADAVATFLNRFEANHLVRGIVGREPLRPDLLKPHPSLILAALDIAQRPPADAVLIGDSITDIEVARITGVTAIGYAKCLARGGGLLAAGADAVTNNMTSLHP